MSPPPPETPAQDHETLRSETDDPKSPQSEDAESENVESEIAAEPDDAAGSGLWKPILFLAAVGLVVFLLRYFDLGVGERVTASLDWVRSLGWWAPVVFVLGYALATVALIPGSILTLAGGVLFGLGWGTVYVFVAAMLGSVLAFLVARYLARGVVESRLEGNERFRVVDRAVAAEGTKIVFLLRLVPFIPFVWLNYGLGLTRVKLRQYVVGGFGMLPATFLYVYYGTAIGSLASLAEGDRPERGWEQWALLGVGLLAAIAVTTLITRRARRELAAVTSDLPAEEAAS